MDYEEKGPPRGKFKIKNISIKEGTTPSFIEFSMLRVRRYLFKNAKNTKR